MNYTKREIDGRLKPIKGDTEWEKDYTKWESESRLKQKTAPKRVPVYYTKREIDYQTSILGLKKIIKIFKEYRGDYAKRRLLS